MCVLIGVALFLVLQFLSEKSGKNCVRNCGKVKKPWPKLERKGKNQESSFTLPLLTGRVATLLCVTTCHRIYFDILLSCIIGQ